jgi:hypothetical protein
MPVIINEFEVVPEPSTTTPNRREEKPDAGSKAKGKPDFHHTWFHWHQRAKRVRAY